MVEVNGAYKHDGNEKTGMNSLHVMSNVKIFAMQNKWMANWPATQTQLIT